MYKFLTCFFVFILLSINKYSLASASNSIIPYSTIHSSTNEAKPVSVRNLFTDEMSKASLSILYATDQFTDKVIATHLQTIASPQKPVSILVGDNTGGSDAESVLQKNSKITLTKVVTIDKKKMHNKFLLLEGTTLFAGSPNASKNAFDVNIESLVRIENTLLTQLYKTYYDNVAAQNISPVCIQSIEDFNAGSATIKVCLAPARCIKGFIKEEIKDAKEIFISMFLISRGSKKDLENDLIMELAKLSNKDIPITIKYNSGLMPDYMKDAIKALASLSGNKIKLFGVKMKKGSMHDKLILVKREANQNKVIIGSAGFTKSVQKNRNYENMLSIQDNDKYDYFLNHFNKIGTSSKVKLYKQYELAD